MGAVWILFLRPAALGGTTAFVVVRGNSMEPALHPGDLVITTKRPSYQVGDIVAFRIPAGQARAGSLVIHRIIGGSPADGYVLQGDNKHHPDAWRPTPSDVAGRVWIRLSGVGFWIAVLRHPLVMATAAAALAVLSVLFWEATPTARRRPKQVAADPVATGSWG